MSAVKLSNIQAGSLVVFKNKEVVVERIEWGVRNSFWYIDSNGHDCWEYMDQIESVSVY